MEMDMENEEQTFLIQGLHKKNTKSICCKRLKYIYLFFNTIVLCITAYYSIFIYYTFEDKYGKLEKKVDKITKPIHELNPIINTIHNLNMTQMYNEIHHDIEVVNEVINLICAYIDCNTTSLF